ncbi:restriction endonuclease subunit S [Kitasatospora purpeofusca]|uniref:restriction endonuclease subunit S n=1 Tax=Kitasatospora purpeofusca TaxID=67352 RepID=UPI00366706A7
MKGGTVPYGTDLPDGWGTSPLKYLASLTNGYVFNSQDWKEHGTPIIRIENLNGSRDFNYSDSELGANHRITKGDLLFSWSGNPGTSFGPFRWALPGDFYLNQHIFKVDAFGCDKDWLFWALKAATHWIERELTSGMIGMVHVTKEDLKSVPIPIPPLEEQRRLAKFLDAETARIDQTADLQKAARAALLERRATAVFGAVTGTSFQDRVPSTLAWVRTLPAHWYGIKLGHVARIGSGHTPSRSKPEWWEDCTIPWITTGEVSQVRDDRREFLNETRERISELGMANSSAELHPKGTVVLCRTASAGYSAVMGQDMATSQDFVAWTCGPRLDPLYLLWCLRAMRSDLLGRLAMGSTHKTIYVPDLQMLRIPLPPIQEQQQIVKSIRAANTAVDDAVDVIDHQLYLLAERRQALITAAVTGQFDVTSASRPIPSGGIA